MSIVSFVSPESNTEITSFIDKKNDKIWFKAKNVATVLGYKKPRDAIERHVSQPHTVFIQEHGVYQLAFSSYHLQKSFKDGLSKKFSHPFVRLGLAQSQRC